MMMMNLLMIEYLQIFLTHVELYFLTDPNPHLVLKMMNFSFYVSSYAANYLTMMIFCALPHVYNWVAVQNLW